MSKTFNRAQAKAYREEQMGLRKMKTTRRTSGMSWRFSVNSATCSASVRPARPSAA